MLKLVSTTQRKYLRLSYDFVKVDEFPETHVAVTIRVEVIKHLLSSLRGQIKLFLEHFQSIDFLKAPVDSTFGVLVEDALNLGPEKEVENIQF